MSHSTSHYAIDRQREEMLARLERLTADQAKFFNTKRERDAYEDRPKKK